MSSQRSRLFPHPYSATPTPARQSRPPKPPSRRAQRTSSHLSFSTPPKSLRTASIRLPIRTVSIASPIRSSRKELKRASPRRFARRVGEQVGQRWSGYWECDGVYVGLRDLDEEQAKRTSGSKGSGKRGTRMVRSISKMGGRVMRSWSGSSTSGSFKVTRPNRTSSSSEGTSSPASSRTSSATSTLSFQPIVLFHKVTSKLSRTSSEGTEGESKGWWTRSAAKRDEHG